MADSPSNDKKLSYQEWVTRAEQLAASFNVTCVRPEGPISDASTKDLQRAIDLYESSHFVEATTLFKDLAGRQDAPPLSQVLYGLSLRNGWGCSTDMVAGFANFQRAVVSATRISGGKDAYGEMAVGLFELGNCYRNGWGCDRNDQVARQYYETAANLGDADAMLSAAECCLNGIGGTKNKHLAAMYYRMAEPLGRAEVGNSWIW
jgi:TPR repeat protein